MVSSQRATLVRCCLLVGATVAVVAAMWVISNLSAHAWATVEQPAIGRDCLHCGQPLRPRPVATSEIGHSRAGPIGCFSGPAHRHHRHQLSAISSSPPCGPVSGPAQRLHKARWAHSTGSTTALILCSPEPVHRRHHPGAASPWSSCGPVPDTAQQQPLAAIRRAGVVSPPAGAGADGGGSRHARVGFAACGAGADAGGSRHARGGFAACGAGADAGGSHHARGGFAACGAGAGADAGGSRHGGAWGSGRAERGRGEDPIA